MAHLKTGGRVLGALTSLVGAGWLIVLAIWPIVAAYGLPDTYLKKGLEIFTRYLIAVPLYGTAALALAGVALILKVPRAAALCQLMAALIQLFLTQGRSYDFPIYVVLHPADDTVTLWASLAPALLFALGGLLTFTLTRPAPTFRGKQLTSR